MNDMLKLLVDLVCQAGTKQEIFLQGYISIPLKIQEGENQRWWKMEHGNYA